MSSYLFCINRKYNSLLKSLFVSCVLLSLILASGCQFIGRPRLRAGYVPSSTMRTPFVNPEKLGSHGYGFSLTERNGVIYTRRGGHLDTGHLRIAADWTAYLARKVNRHLLKGDEAFAFKFSIEPSVYHINLVYPGNWENMPIAEKEQIARKISIRLGQYFAYTATNWHEIITWFGYKSTGIYPEFPSAFAWEDSFSDLLGTHLAAKALRDPQREYDEAMTLAIDRELESLGPQSGRTARKASIFVPRRGKP